MRLKLFVLIFWGYCASSAANPIHVDLDEASNKFASGDYASAAHLFQQAIDEGDQSDTSKYNLAVSYFKNSQYLESERYFRELLDSEQFSALSRLNLCIIAIKNGKNEEAIVWLDEILASNPSDNTRKLAGDLYNRLHSGSEREVQAQKNSFGLLSIGSTIADSNLTYEGAASGVGKYAATTDLNLLIGSNLGGLRLSRTEVITNVLASKNHENAEYDFLYASGGINQAIVYAPVRLETGVQLNSFALGRSPYEYESELSLKTSNRFADDHYRFKALLAWSLIRALKTDYQFENGMRSRIRCDFIRYFLPGYVSIVYEWERNDRANDISNELVSSYSPIRNSVKAALLLNLASRLSIKLQPEYRLSDFQIDNLIYVNGNLNNVRRKENRLRFVSEFRYEFVADWSFIASYIYERNNSTIASYTYDRNKISMEINWSY